jgi:phage host-nuclease inhibitor protein Gam
MGVVDPPIDHRDVTTTMGLLGDIQRDVRRIRTLLEDENGEEEKEEREPNG